MDRRIRTLIVVGIAVLLGSVASYVVWMKIAPRTNTEIKTMAVVVAAKPLPAGIAITIDDLRIIEMPVTHPINGAITKKEDAIGKGALVSLVENEVITLNKLTPHTGLPAQIKTGMRVISLMVNDIIGVAGFVKAGDRVDVIMIEDANGENSARVVLSDVEVFTSGKGSAEQDTVASRREKTKTDPNEGNVPKPTTVVTVLVTPLQAAQLALAQTSGNIVLALRNPDDKKPANGTATTMPQLLGLNPKTIDAIRGSRLTKEPVK